MLQQKLFKYYRTFTAYRKVHEALDKFRQVAGSDRFATVGMAQMEIAADLCEQVGQLPVARDLRNRVSQLETAAEQAAIFGKRGKRKIAQTLGVTPKKLAAVQAALEETPANGAPKRRGRPRRQSVEV